jgi:hypothetical protein
MTKVDKIAKQVIEDVINVHTDKDEWPPGVPSQEILWDMRRNGMPRPEGVPAVLWNNLKSIGYSHENIADLMLLGYTKTEIAQKLGASPAGISVTTRTPTFKAYYLTRRAERKEQINRDGLSELYDAAVDTAGEIMQDETAKQQTRLAAATFIIEQTVGKAKQEVKVESTNLLSAVIARVDELKSRPVSEQPEFLVKEKDKFDNFIDALESGTPYVIASEENSDGQKL